MTFIRREVLTPKQAKALHKLGFILSFKYSFDKESDLYEIYAK